MGKVNELIKQIDDVCDIDINHAAGLISKPHFLLFRQIQDFLKSLQSGNEDLLAELNKCRDDYTTSEVPSEILHALDRAIAALSRPAPFDVLGHLMEGGVGSDQYGNLFKFEDGQFLVKNWNSDHFTSDRHSFLECLIHGDIVKPYTQPEPELEDGWYWVKHSERPDLTDEPFIAKLYSYCTGQNKRWESRYIDVPFSSCVPITNPATGKPWRIEQPKESEADD